MSSPPSAQFQHVLRRFPSLDPRAELVKSTIITEERYCPEPDDFSCSLKTRKSTTMSYSTYSSVGSIDTESSYGSNARAVLVFSERPSKSTNFEIHFRQQDGTTQPLYRVISSHGQMKFSRVANIDLTATGRPRCQSLENGAGGSRHIGTVSFSKLTSKTHIEIPGYAKVTMLDGKQNGGFGLGKLQFSKAAKSGRRGSEGDNIGDIMAMIVANRGLYWRKRKASSNHLEEYHNRDEVTIAQFKPVELQDGLSYGRDRLEVSMSDSDLGILDVVVLTGIVVMLQQSKASKQK